MSDHRHITFELTDVRKERMLWRNPRKIDWAAYEDELAAKFKHLPDNLRMFREIEHCADSLRECIVRSYESNCSLSIKAEGYDKIWVVSKFSALLQDVRRLYNKSYRSKHYNRCKI